MGQERMLAAVFAHLRLGLRHNRQCITGVEFVKREKKNSHHTLPNNTDPHKTVLLPYAPSRAVPSHLVISQTRPATESHDSAQHST